MYRNYARAKKKLKQFYFSYFLSQDFTANANRSYPTSCCTSDITEQISISKRPFASAVVFRNDDLTIQSLKDQQQKNLTEITDLTWNHVVMAAKGGESKTIAACRAVYPQVGI
jgi:hypothetical protein